MNVGIGIELFLGGAIIAYALKVLFTISMFSVISTPEQYFEIKVDGEEQPGSVGPGKFFDISPTVYNHATEEMYVFITVSDGGGMSLWLEMAGVR